MPKSDLTEKLTSAASDLWRTPDPLFARLHQEFDFGLDLAALHYNRKLRRYLGPDHKVAAYRDALAISWADTLHAIAEVEKRRVAGFVNPPFSLLDDFVEKAWEERKRGAVIVMVNPQKTETVWYHEIAPHADEIRQLRRRISYMKDDGTTPAPALFASAVYVFNGRAPILGGGPRVSWWDLGLPPRKQKKEAA
jgi:phage N-6-adenine-methyltransferase